MSGKSADSPRTKDSVEAQVTGYVKAGAVMEGLVDAFIAACRTNLPAVHLPGQTTFQSTHVQASVDVVGQHTRMLETQIAEAEKRATKAVRRELDSDDEEEQLEYRAEGRDARAAARRARAQLAELTAEPTRVNPDGPFDAYTSVLLPAMVQLRRSGGRLSQEAANALDTLMPSFHMEQRRGRWWGVATVRVNTVDGVAELGPIEWELQRPGRGTSRLVGNLTATPRTGAESKLQLENQLVSSGQVTQAAAAVLRNAPFQQLPHVVLYGVAGLPVPDWVGEEWTQPEFVSWVTEVYSNPAFTWLSNGKYGQVSNLRQAVATFAARTRAPFTLQELRQMVPVDDPAQLNRLIHPYRSHPRSRTREWEPTIVLVDEDVPGQQPRRVAGVTCACGDIASIATRVPEVTRDLLCDCGRMPDAGRFGMDPATRFPREYLQLRLPFDDCVGELTDAATRRRANLSPKLVKVMGQHQLLSAGATELELEAAIVTRTVWTEVRKLENFGYVQRDDSRPARVSYTPKGREAAGLPPA